MKQVKPRSETFRTAAVAAKPEAGPADLVLLDEACRLLDRLDWLASEIDADPTPALLAEARSQTGELRQVLKALDLPGTKAVAAGPTKLEVLLGGATG